MPTKAQIITPPQDSRNVVPMNYAGPSIYNQVSIPPSVTPEKRTNTTTPMENDITQDRILSTPSGGVLLETAPPAIGCYLKCSGTTFSILLLVAL